MLVVKRLKIGNTYFSVKTPPYNSGRIITCSIALSKVSSGISFTPFFAFEDSIPRLGTLSSAVGTFRELWAITIHVIITIVIVVVIIIVIIIVSGDVHVPTFEEILIPFLIIKFVQRISCSQAFIYRTIKSAV